MLITLIALNALLVVLLFLNMRAKFRYHLRCRSLLDALHDSGITEERRALVKQQLLTIDEIPFDVLFRMHKSEGAFRAPLDLNAFHDRES